MQNDQFLHLIKSLKNEKLKNKNLKKQVRENKRKSPSTGCVLRPVFTSTRSKEINYLNNLIEDKNSQILELNLKIKNLEKKNLELNKKVYDLKVKKESERTTMQECDILELQGAVNTVFEVKKTFLHFPQQTRGI